MPCTPLWPCACSPRPSASPPQLSAWPLPQPYTSPLHYLVVPSPQLLVNLCYLDLDRVIHLLKEVGRHYPLPVDARGVIAIVAANVTRGHGRGVVGCGGKNEILTETQAQILYVHNRRNSNSDKSHTHSVWNPHCSLVGSALEGGYCHDRDNLLTHYPIVQLCPRNHHLPYCMFSPFSFVLVCPHVLTHW